MVDYLEPQQDFLAELAFSFEQQDFSLPQQDFLLQLSSEASGAAGAEPHPPQPALAVATANAISTGMSRIFIGFIWFRIG